SLVLGTPFFIFFGWLSDKIGRKPIIMAGCLIAALTYFPIYKAMTHYGNPAIETASASNPVTVAANPADCHFQFNPTGTARFTTNCDKAKAQLARSSVPYFNAPAEAGKDLVITVGTTRIEGYDDKKLAEALKTAGYPTKADPNTVDKGMLILLLLI